MEHITLEQYATRVASRSSKEFYEHKMPGPVLACLLNEVSDLAECVDAAKKTLFYGKQDIATALKYSIVAAQYDWEPADGILSLEEGRGELSESQQQTLHAIIGIITEAGELADAVLKAFGAVQMGRTSLEDAFDEVNLREEYGDVLWYTQLGLSAIRSSIPECITVNDCKLEKRYGPAFNVDGAVNRDLDAERKELEK